MSKQIYYSFLFISIFISACKNISSTNENIHFNKKNKQNKHNKIIKKNKIQKSSDSYKKSSAGVLAPEIDDEKIDIPQNQDNATKKTILAKYLKNIRHAFDQKKFNYKNLITDAILLQGLLYNLREIYNHDSNFKKMLNFFLSRGPSGDIHINKSNIQIDKIDDNFIKIVAFAISYLDFAKDIINVDLTKVVLLVYFLQDFPKIDIKKFLEKNKSLVFFKKPNKKKFERLSKNKMITFDDNKIKKILKSASNIYALSKQEMDKLNELFDEIFFIYTYNKKETDSKKFSISLALEILKKYINKIIKNIQSDERKSNKNNNPYFLDKSLNDYIKLSLMTLLLKLPYKIDTLREGFKSIINEKEKNILSGKGNENDWKFNGNDLSNFKRRFENKGIPNLLPEELIYYFSEFDDYKKLNIKYINNAIFTKNNQKYTFPNCTESTILSLINFVLYNRSKNLFDISKISGKNTICSDIKRFYKKYPSIDDMIANKYKCHNDWAQIISGNPQILNYKNKDFNLSASHLNIYKILKIVFPEIILSEEDEKNETNLTDFYEKLAKIIDKDFEIFKEDDKIHFVKDSKTIFELIVDNYIHAEIYFKNTNYNKYKKIINDNTENTLINKIIDINTIDFEILDKLSEKKILNLLLLNPLTRFKDLINVKSILKHLKKRNNLTYKNEIEEFISNINKKIASKFLKEFQDPNLTPDPATYLEIDTILNFINTNKNRYGKFTDKIKNSAKSVLKNLDISGYRLNILNPNSKINLGKSQFNNIDFTEADLSNYNIKNCTFYNCIFDKTKFNLNSELFSNFRYCSFKNTNIKADEASSDNNYNSDNKFSYCTFIGNEIIIEGDPNLKNCTLKNMYNPVEFIKKTNFSTSVHFDNITFDNDHLKFIKGSLDKIIFFFKDNINQNIYNFLKKDIKGLVFENIDFRKQEIPEDIFELDYKVTFKKCKFESLEKKSFKNINNQKIIFSGIDFSNVNLNKINFSNVKIQDSDLSLIDFSNISFKNLDIDDCSFSKKFLLSIIKTKLFKKNQKINFNSNLLQKGFYLLEFTNDELKKIFSSEKILLPNFKKGIIINYKQAKFIKDLFKNKFKFMKVQSLDNIDRFKIIKK